MIELFVIHTFHRYDSNLKKLQTFDGSYIDQYRLARMSNDDFSSDVFNLLHRLAALKISNDMIAVLSCITLFSPDRDYNAELNKSMYG